MNRNKNKGSNENHSYLKGTEMTDTNVTEVPTTSKLGFLKNIVRNRKVQFGVAIAVTAVASALIARSDLFEKQFSLQDVQDIVADAELTEAVKS